MLISFWSPFHFCSARQSGRLITGRLSSARCNLRQQSLRPVQDTANSSPMSWIDNTHFSKFFCALLRIGRPSRLAWLQNPMPANWWLNDKHGSWTLSIMGGGSAPVLDDLPDLSSNEWGVRNPGSARPVTVSRHGTYLAGICFRNEKSP
ncbi:DUF4087 domain-containing protein [Paraburkholderia graminis]|uniref:DUF4087 domain-containing protein n=1 Tax=Paraburkholderia graminis TaxID=60548 RepID=UPI003CAC4669